MTILIFRKTIITDRSQTVGSDGADIDFFAIPKTSLISISAQEGKIILYFKEGNPYEKFTGGTTNIRGYEYAQVELLVEIGQEVNAISGLAKQLFDSPAIILFDDVNNNFDVRAVSGIGNIKRFDDFTTVATDPSSGGGGSLPTGGVENQVLTKQSATDGDADWNYLQDIYLIVENVSGGTLSKGTPVHITGENGNGNPTVIAARADTPSAMPANFILAEAIDDGVEGIAFLIGRIQGVNTSSFNAGDVVYVGATGGYTTTKPTGTNLIQNLGIVTAVDASNGGGWIYGAGRSNDIPNLPAGKFFIGSATNTTESAYTLPVSDGSANQFLKTNGSGTVSFQSIIQATGNELENVSDDTSPALGGDLILNSFGNYKIITKAGTNGDIKIQPDGTGNVGLGDWDLKTDQTLGASEDGHVLTYDHSLGKAQFAASAVGGSATQTFSISFEVNINTSEWYYGNSRYGWNYVAWTAKDSDMSIFHSNQNNGMIVNGSYTTIHCNGVASNVTSSGNTIEFELWHSSNPNGSTSAVSPTSLASQSVVMTTQSALYELDFGATGLTISAGDLIWLTVRDPDNSGTQYIRPSITITLS